MKEVFVLTGLGADETVFKYLDFGNARITHIPWTLPAHPKETIEAYAKRIAEGITAPEPILVGLSFGGMVSVEVAKHIQAKKVILLSSAKGQKEIPFYLRWAGVLGLHHLFPSKLMLRPNALTFWFLGIKTTEHKHLFTRILGRTHPDTFRWCVNAILTWKNKPFPANYIHIHGTADRVLPYSLVQCTHAIKGGGHSMVVTHPSQISALLQQYIQE